jgi:N-glycosylase/DNA lyase
VAEAIGERLSEFRSFDRRDHGRLFGELVFCLLTPQSSARRADRAVRELSLNGLLIDGGVGEVASVLRRCGVRFHNRKALYVVRNRLELGSGRRITEMLVDDAAEAREILVKNVWGLGYKESSHFLRNIGYSGVAILDRHVLRGLAGLGVLRSPTPPTSRRAYLRIERLFIEAAEAVGVEPEALDLLLWYEATGEVFK